MTREDCIKKLEAVEDDYCRGIRQFTIDLFDEDINDICNEEYINNEEEDLGALFYKCDNILGIMRRDIIDCDAITRIKFIIGQRLKTIQDERKREG